VAAVHQHVGCHQEVGAGFGAQDRTVVADAEFGRLAGLRSLTLADPVDEGEFAELRFFDAITD